MVMYYKGCHIGYRPFYNSVICMYKMAFVKLLLGTRILLLLLFFFFLILRWYVFVLRIFNSPEI